MGYRTTWYLVGTGPRAYGGIKDTFGGPKRGIEEEITVILSQLWGAAGRARTGRGGAGTSFCISCHCSPAHFPEFSLLSGRALPASQTQVVHLYSGPLAKAPKNHTELSGSLTAFCSLLGLAFLLPRPDVSTVDAAHIGGSFGCLLVHLLDQVTLVCCPGFP